MGAREKLNGAHICGILLLAAMAGSATGSLAVFFIAAVVLLALAVHTGDIRPTKHR
jgi:hypothetical protein